MIKLLLWLGLYGLAWPAQAQEFLVLEGDLPAQYLSAGRKNYYQHGAVVIHLTGEQAGLIAEVTADQRKIRELANDPDVQLIKLLRNGAWDVIYPGLIDLHNHTKQNNLGIWQDAHGQFANRFEWRAWTPYRKAISNNMNPWIGYGKAITCAAFRWSEIQAMVVGTTYLQGPSSCVSNFAIHQVESSEAFRTGKDNVQAPTDLVTPNDMVYVWQTLAKDILAIQRAHPENSPNYHLAYEEALAKNINHHCDFASQGITTEINKNNISEDEGLTILTDKELLEKACTKNLPLPTKFIRYIYWVHKSIAGKKKYAEQIEKGNGSAIIAHLAEGRRDDDYNQKEFALVKLLGMARPHVNFVHGVGIDEHGLATMARQQMGLIWSPFSNLLLYNQTLDVELALRKGVIIALGSDWLPTGSKGPLEELKIARQYLLANNLQGALLAMPGADSLDEALYKMVTENPAKMINQWQNLADDSRWQNGADRGGVGALIKNAMGTLIVTSKLAGDPYTNLVARVWEADINLVVVDGKVQYGNVSYLKQLNLDFETLPNGEHYMENLQQLNIPVLALQETEPSKEQENNFLVELGKIVTANADRVRGPLSCEFSEAKGFVLQNTLDQESDLQAFKLASGLNLDRFADLQRLLGINLMTQSRNRNDEDKGDKDYQPQHFTPLYSCNDSYHSQRLNNFIGQTWPADRASRLQRIKDEGHGKVPQRLAEKFPSLQ